MGTQWLTTMKPSFQTAWLALSPKETHQVLEKLTLLSQDPSPDGKVKKQLKYLDGKLHRLRCGDYRIFYTFQKPYISLLALVRRSEDTYDEEQDAEFLGGLNPFVPGYPKAAQPDWERLFAPRPAEKRPLPEPITVQLLTLLHVPEQYHARLIPLQTEEDLLDCPGVPDDVLLTIDEVMYERPLTQIIQQPDYILPKMEDLMRLKEGELLAFLLKLSPEQEKAALWSETINGPTQVKGAPGTGKSTVALYRIRSLIEKLRQQSLPLPRILYTTYTNALVESSRQLLTQLLGEDANCVEVTTADKLVVAIVGKAYKATNRSLKIAEETTLMGALKRARAAFQAKADPALVNTFANLAISDSYLLEELLQVIIARDIPTIQEYMTTEAKRSGRQRSLNADQRRAIWYIYEYFLEQLAITRCQCWQQVRHEAERLFQEQPLQGRKMYDAVVVDEAQDLDPAVIRLLFAMCKATNRFFITADANQSIYTGSFRWTAVHEALKFTGGRTTNLRTNYRSTQQISMTAQAYLAEGALETEPVESLHIYQGALPLVYKARSQQEEFEVLANFLPTTARGNHLPLSACAVLCPTKERGREFAEELIQRGVQAQFMAREQLDLTFRGVKVLTLHSAKGLEFPLVALAGFKGSRFDHPSELVQPEEQEETLRRNKRILFVGMTRAMHMLLFIVPANTSSPLLTTFNPRYWTILEREAITIGRTLTA